VDAFFLDDSRQDAPSRAGMGPLVASGGIYVPDASVAPLAHALDELCLGFGFPDGEQFKWSPGRDEWMRDNLVAERREEFFRTALGLAQMWQAQAIVVVEDSSHGRATDAATPEDDVVRLFLERADNLLRGRGTRGEVFADRPGGDRAAEDRFVAGCIDTLREGTRFVQFDSLAHVVTTPARFMRLVQLADVVTSSTTAFVAGHVLYAEPVFEAVRPILRRELGRIGGVGLKIHPDLRYANLYHWLLGDDYIIRAGVGHPLPDERLPYAASPDHP
jgi:hypothetical protein